MNRYLLLPFNGTPLLLVASFSVGHLLAVRAGLLGIPLGLVLLSWFFKYCFVLLDSVVAGDDEPPVLSVEMVNPIDEQRPLALALLITAECMGIFALRRAGWPVLSLGASALCVAALPANIALLGVTRSPFQAAWPPALLSVVTTLGWAYWGLIAALAALAGIGYRVLLHSAALWLILVVAQWMLLLTFALVGGMLFEHRHALGIETRTRQERMAERDAREHEAERKRTLDTAYSKFRVSRPQEGWQEIQAWLRNRETPEQRIREYRALLDAASAWEDVRPADKLANELIALLLARKATGEALGVAERRFASNANFELEPAGQATRIAALAGAAGKRALQRRVRGES